MLSCNEETPSSQCVMSHQYVLYFLWIVLFLICVVWCKSDRVIVIQKFRIHILRCEVNYYIIARDDSMLFFFLLEVCHGFDSEQTKKG